MSMTINDFIMANEMPIWLQHVMVFTGEENAAANTRSGS
jgi:hypothetical protein